MNGEIPSVPITTLAGIQSLTDLLPELPLPSPLPSTLSNKSLLFHPRVAEEAKRLLNVRDEALVPQLAHALAQTNTDDIELNDIYAGGDSLSSNIPELLKAVFSKNPTVFKTKKATEVSPHSAPTTTPCSQTITKPKLSASNTSNYNQQSPVYPSPHASPYASNPSPSRYTPQDSPAGRVPPHGSPGQCATQMSPYSAVSPQHTGVQPGKFISHKFPVPAGNKNSNPPSLTQTFIHGSSHLNESGDFLASGNVCNLNSNNSNVANANSRTGGLIQQPGSVGSVAASSSSSASSPVINNNQLLPNVSEKPALNVNSKSDHSVTPHHQQLNNFTPPDPGRPPDVVDVKSKDIAINGSQSDTSHNSTFDDPFPKLEVKSVQLPSQGMNHVADVKSLPPEANPQKVDKLNKPVVLLNKLTPKEEALALKNIKKVISNDGDKVIINDSSRRSTQKKVIKKSISDDESSGDDIIRKRKERDRYYKDRIKRRTVDGKFFKGSTQKRKKLSSSDEEYKPDIDENCATSLSERVKRRKRLNSGHQSYTQSISCNKSSEKFVECDTSENSTPKPKIKREKKVRKLLHENLTTEELMDTNTFKRFNGIIDFIFESSEDVDLNADQDQDADEDNDCPAEALIPRQQLEELCVEAAKLKTQKAMDQVPSERLVRLLNILERNIRDGAKVLPIQPQDDVDEEESRLWLELTIERVMRSVDASLTAIYIMTSPNMPKSVYLEDIIDRMIMFTKFQLQNTVYPVFDPAYRLDPKTKDGYIGNIKQKRARAHSVKQRSIIQLYNKLSDIVQLVSDLLELQILPDTTVLQISTLGVCPFFVENVSELQLSALRLVTTVFSRYKKHRSVILEDILSSFSRLPTTKRNLRNYRINSEEQIQMVSALALQLIQCVVQLPKPEKKSTSSESEADRSKTQMANEMLIVSSYENAMSTAYYFLSVFLKKCSGKNNEELDYRPLFENFIQDLLCTVNKPEWPAAEFLLSLLGKLLFQNFSNKSHDMSLRVASLDYLGVVASRLRRDAVSSHLKQEQIDEIIKQTMGDDSSDDDEALIHIRNKEEVKKKLQPLLEKSDKTQVLQKALLDYLSSNIQSDPSLQFASQFFIAQWYKDAVMEAKVDKENSPSKNKQLSTPRQKNPKKKIKSKRKGRRKTIDSSSEEAEETSEESEVEDEADGAESDSEEKKNADVWALAEKRKKFLMSVINLNAISAKSISSKLDYESAELVSRFLAAKRPFSKSFDIYLKQILTVLNETAIAVRTKAMKCLASVVEADPEILGRTDMQYAVRNRLLDQSTSVREAAVDLVGKYVHVRPEITSQYYSMLVDRILDTGVSVRKRVIKILKEICVEQPDFPKIADICVRIIRRVNDEDGIKKLVHEVFQNMWFTPVKDKDSDRILKKVLNITDVVAACSNTGYDWFEQLLTNLLKNKEDVNYKPVLKSCRQIVDCLVENVLSCEESSSSEDKKGTGVNKMLVPCLTTLYLFAKIYPPLMINHAMTLQPYLSMKCQTQGDQLVLMNVTRTMELVVPLMDHPSESFLAQLEEDMIKLIFCKNFRIVNCCVSCLGAVVNNVTHNYKLIRDSFHKFFNVLCKIRKEHSENPGSQMLVQNLHHLRRSLFTTGLFCQHFDMNKESVGDKQLVSLKESVFDNMMYFLRHELEDVRFNALTGLGFMAIRYYDLMLGVEVRSLYTRLLTDPSEPIQLTVQTLKNLQRYLTEEETKMLKTESEWSDNSKKEDLKEMGDIASGMASTIVQVFLKQILQACVSTQSSIRSSSLNVLQLVLDQGLVHPVQMVPYLICLSTDTEFVTRCLADKLLQEIGKKYPGFVQMKALAGVKLSYKLQHILRANKNSVIRGFRKGENMTSLNAYVYSTLRGSRPNRRAFMMSLLKLYDEQAKTPLDELIYVADNVAHFPYQAQDEPLFLIHHIDVIISVSGSNLLQTFKENLKPLYCSNSLLNNTFQQNEQLIQDDDDDDDVESVIKRLPEDISVLKECMSASIGCRILLSIKAHLKEMYGFTDGKIQRYSPSEAAKVYERPLNRRPNVIFNPIYALEILKEIFDVEETESPEYVKRQELIEQYLEFKQLMLSLDPADDEDEMDRSVMNKSANESLKDPSVQVNGGVTISVIESQSEVTKSDVKDQSKDVKPPQVIDVQTVIHQSPANTHQFSEEEFQSRRVGNTTIIIKPPKPIKSSSKSSKEKSHRKKKKKRKRIIESEDEEHHDSDGEESDPDWS